MSDVIWDLLQWSSQFSWLTEWSFELLVVVFFGSLLTAGILTRRAMLQRTSQNPGRRSRRRAKFFHRTVRRERGWTA